jgi:hypothetical protein
MIRSRLNILAEEMHTVWLQEKKEQGFHLPEDCISLSRTYYIAKDNKLEERDKETSNSETCKWCNRCLPNMYAYEDISSIMKVCEEEMVRRSLDFIDNIVLIDSTPTPIFNSAMDSKGERIWKERY